MNPVRVAPTPAVALRTVPVRRTVQVVQAQTVAPQVRVRAAVRAAVRAVPIPVRVRAVRVQIAVQAVHRVRAVVVPAANEFQWISI